jgi:16S rRNA (guanine966-N2)-methyltransferase
MRVVSGQAKGRRLKSPRTAGTRPILDRVKTALFDILSTRVEDARFLDLFAGTGGVGIEALSRGAASATFIELNAGVLKLVRENLQITGLAEGAETLHTDAFKFLQAHSGENLAGNKGARKNRLDIPPNNDSSRRMDRIPYDIVYVAPPQYKGMAARALELLDSSPLVADTGLVIIQIFPKERDEVAAVALSRLALVDERRYGSTLLMFYEANKEKVSHVDTTREA